MKGERGARGSVRVWVGALLVAAACRDRADHEALVFAGHSEEASPVRTLATLTQPAGPSRDSPIHAQSSEPAVERAPDEASIDAWIAALADDDVPGNATRADRFLFLLGDRAVPALTAALASHDSQQRLWAGHLLRRLSAEPTEALLDVTLETLTYEEGHYGGRRLMMIREAAPYLEEHANEANSRLVQAVQGRDAYRRFFAAVLLARTQSSNGIGAVCDVLIDHLESNETANDAVIAGKALQSYGNLAMPFVCMAQETGSEQAWKILRIIELHQTARTSQEEVEYLQLRRNWWPGYNPDESFFWRHDVLLYGASIPD